MRKGDVIRRCIVSTQPDDVQVDAFRVLGELEDAKPRLPRVSPENLVEGEWYVWRSAGKIHVGQFYSCGPDSKYIRCGVHGIPVMDWNVYYGPLPEFRIGGAE